MLTLFLFIASITTEKENPSCESPAFSQYQDTDTDLELAVQKHTCILDCLSWP